MCQKGNTDKNTRSNMKMFAFFLLPRNFISSKEQNRNFLKAVRQKIFCAL